MARHALTIDDLSITSSTLGNPPFAQLVDSAVGAGLSGVSIWPEHDYQRAREMGMTDRELRTRLADAGLVVTDVDCAVVWAGPDDPGGPYFEEAPLDTIIEAATALDAPLVNLLVIGNRGASTDDAVDAIGQLCDRLAPHDLTAMIEFSRRTLAPTLPAALDVVDKTGRANVGVLVDTWHVHWGAADIDSLRAVDGQMVHGIQFNDAPAEQPADLLWATRYERLVPGEGAADLVGMTRAFRATGVTCPLTIEVFNQQLLDREGPEAFAKRLADATRGVLERADG